jgi:hypothetical protein
LIVYDLRLDALPREMIAEGISLGWMPAVYFLVPYFLFGVCYLLCQLFNRYAVIRALLVVSFYNTGTATR